jgi:hypothetical protein
MNKKNMIDHIKAIIFKRIITSIIIILFISTANIQAFSQEITINKSINWAYQNKYNMEKAAFQQVFTFNDAQYVENELFKPYCYLSVPVHAAQDIKVELENVVTEQVALDVFDGNDFKKEFFVQSSISILRNEQFADIRILPIRLSDSGDSLQILKKFSIHINWQAKPKNKSISYRAVSNSVLASGDWYKLQITETGVYKIDYSMLQDMGLDPSAINPQNIRIYGNGGGMLPQANAENRADDLLENAIMVVGEADRSFDQNDYVLFYAKGPHDWYYDEVYEMFRHRYNYYADHACYFLTIGSEKGKRIQEGNTSTQAADYVSTTYQFRSFYEENKKTEVSDYVKSGRDWFADEFALTTKRIFSFTVPSINKSEAVKFISSVAGRSSTMNAFSLLVDGNKYTQSIIAVNTSDYLAQYCNVNVLKKEFMPTTANLDFNYEYIKPNSSSIGWMNYLLINATSNLIINSGQLKFRDIHSRAAQTTEYRLTSTLSDLEVWKLSNHTEPGKIAVNKQGNYFYFRSEDSLITEYIAFEHQKAKKPVFLEKIENQNLHAIENVELIIISHGDYLDAANKLADHRRNHDGYTVEVVEISKVYNEFSSGTQDVTAIRDFVKHVYDKANTPGRELKYLLLIGDASYDYKDVLTGNTNDIPTYQSPEIYSPIYSYASDDYFGFLDDNEGDWDDELGTQYHKIDIGIGRLPVNSADQAMKVVDKIINYSNVSTFGDWRNMIAFVADDVDDSGLNAHVEQSESLTNYISNNVKFMNIQKIYMDAYQQVSSPNGHKYPEATKAINDRMQNGALIMNYIGHGGEVGWAHERVLEVADIKSWENINNTPVFVTATCEFSRYDDPARVSAGELVLLNTEGGGVALLTTSRVVWVHANNDLTNKLYKNNIFEMTGNRHKTLGEVIMLTKNLSTFNENTRKFILLGDPSMKLALPDNRVVATGVPDTIKAFQLVEIKGEVQDPLGQKMTSFNGSVYPTIYDKETMLTTLDNDDKGKALDFYTRKNIIYKGQASVTNGEFSFRFVVPKDISYFNGEGKISFYASNNEVDATGYYEELVVGGTADTIVYDTSGPVVELYIGDTNFVSGGITNENPVLLARVFDSSGINTVGNGIGHEIIAFLDDDEAIELNDYYQSYINSYQAGEIVYPFKNLEEGMHSLSLKVWDVHNNSATASINFVVVIGEELRIDKLMNYPNPFSHSTTFSFEHNFAGQQLEYSLGIYNTQGHLIKMLEGDVFADGNREIVFDWSPYNEYALSMESGVYVYRLLVQTENGQSASKSGRLIYIHR